VVEAGTLVGILSDRDLRRPQWADRLDDWTSYYRISDDLKVSEVMTRSPETIRTYDTIRKAGRVLRERRYGALPVLDKTGALVGMLSAVDLLAALEDLIAGAKRD
jgi:acetoin utilization protein AcuB